jgi:hypothetical protein
MQPTQLSLFPRAPAIMPGTIREKLIALLADDLDFHSANSNYASHQFHAFPAKYPPQLPQKFIAALTEPGDAVLDPMMGSGTTLVEALLAKRQPIGFDTDPLAVRIAKAKTTPIDKRKVLENRRSCDRHLTNFTTGFREISPIYQTWSLIIYDPLLSMAMRRDYLYPTIVSI